MELGLGFGRIKLSDIDFESEYSDNDEQGAEQDDEDEQYNAIGRSSYHQQVAPIFQTSHIPTGMEAQYLPADEGFIGEVCAQNSAAAAELGLQAFFPMPVPDFVDTCTEGCLEKPYLLALPFQISTSTLRSVSTLLVKASSF